MLLQPAMYTAVNYQWSKQEIGCTYYIHCINTTTHATPMACPVCKIKLENSKSVTAWHTTSSSYQTWKRYLHGNYDFYSLLWYKCFMDVAFSYDWISLTHLVQQLRTMHSRVSDTGRRSSGSRGPLSLATHGTQCAQTALYDQPYAQGVRWQRQPFNSHLLTEKQHIKRLPDILILVYQLCMIHPWVQQSEVGVEGGQ